MTFQWHLTDNCTFRCKHCYQDNYSDNALSIDKNEIILDRIAGFVDRIHVQKRSKRSHINFTGGEPFLYKSLFQLVETAVHKYEFSFGILSNGYLLEDEQIKKLAGLKPRFIQLSLEGGKDVNDQIRGVGAYNTVFKAIKKYKEFRIPLLLSFTANSQNYIEFPKVVKFARQNGVNKVWTDRYLPFGKNDQLELQSSDFRSLNKEIFKQNSGFSRLFYPKTIVSSDRALQFLESGGRPYKCSAGKSLLSILPNGDLLPCRRLPIRLGNILEDDLFKIYTTNKVLLDLRNRALLDPLCKKCLHKDDCFGGLKCLSYIKDGDFHRRDPNCWLS